MTTLSPNSADGPMIRGRPQTLARVNLSPKNRMSPTVHMRPEPERQQRRAASPGRGGSSQKVSAGHQHEGVDRALQVRALHQGDRLVRDDRRSRHVRIHRAELPHELLRALALPDVDAGMDLEQEPAARADELAPQLLGHVGEPDGARVEVPLEPVELADEVAVELGLEVGERRLGELAIGRREPLEERRVALLRSCWIFGGPARGLGGGDVEAGA